MCEFVSWIEIGKGKGKGVRFLTGDQLFRTERGRTCREQMGSSDDYTGHGAIRLYYGLANYEGADKECTDFSDPANFPMEIRLALLDGSMKGFPCPRGLLAASLYKEYDGKRALLNADYQATRAPLEADYRAKLAPLDADYRAKRAPLEADYRAKLAPLDADYRAKCDALYADYRAKLAPLEADYQATRAPLDADYRAKLAPLDADYRAKCDALYADYRAKCDALEAELWELIKQPANRAEAWK